jgi:hypothetical protein
LFSLAAEVPLSWGFCSRRTIDTAEVHAKAVDPRCSPKRVRDAHVANELANVRRCRWPATARSGFPAPIGSKSGTVPTDHRLRLENFQCIQYSTSYTVEPRKHQAVNVAEGQSLRGALRSSSQSVQRTAKRRFVRRLAGTYFQRLRPWQAWPAPHMLDAYIEVTRIVVLGPASTLQHRPSFIMNDQPTPRRGGVGAVKPLDMPSYRVICRPFQGMSLLISA